MIQICKHTSCELSFPKVFKAIDDNQADTEVKDDEDETKDDVEAVEKPTEANQAEETDEINTLVKRILIKRIFNVIILEPS